MITGKELAAGKAAMRASALKITTEDVLPERERQNLRFTGHILGTQHHNALTWGCVLGEESGESQQAALDMIFDKNLQENIEARLAHFRNELVQTAAVAFAIIERIDALDGYLIQPEGSYQNGKT
jgi:hypothetical protein